MRSLDITDPRYSHLKSTADSLNNPKFIKSYDFNFAYLKQLPFEQKLELLDNLSESQLAEIYKEKTFYNALISDLAHEQSTLKAKGKGELKNLKKLAKFEFKNPLQKGSIKFSFISELTSDLYHMAQVAKDGMFDSIFKNTMDHLNEFNNSNPLLDDVRGEFHENVISQLEEKQINLESLRAENKKMIDAARIARNKKLPFWKKPFSFFMSDPEFDAKGNKLSESLHNVESKTFQIDAHKSLGDIVDTGQDTFHQNIVADTKKYNDELLERISYDQKVDEKVQYEQLERARNTGKDPNEILRVHGRKGYNHKLKCVLSSLIK